MSSRISVLTLDREKEINGRIKKLLCELYGNDKAEDFFHIITRSINSYLGSRSAVQLERSGSHDSDNPLKETAGKVYAICYPDNINSSGEYPLTTLGRTLERFFPSVKGIHLLPEREMKHHDVWEQDFYLSAGIEKSREITKALKKDGIIDSAGCVCDNFETKAAEIHGKYPKQVFKILSEVRNYHFNDGGFSQKTRKRVDPRFGTDEILSELSGRFSIMLDYVVNHMDIDNEYLDDFRLGKSDGSCFIIINPKEYSELKRSGKIANTFRPRPFPLFTGMRMYPEQKGSRARRSKEYSAGVMKGLFLEAGLQEIPEEVSLMASIYYKLENDQGLTAEDKRIFSLFDDWLKENNIIFNELFSPSEIHSGQYIPAVETRGGLSAFFIRIGISLEQARFWIENGNRVFGELFYIYTTFSESQCDVNPRSEAGFRLIIEDLFTILASGNLTMIRMDAIKYLWKEIGSHNFDMPEGNKLIEIIKLTMQLAAPEVIPLDEVNSPDSTVYEMGKNGGFYYLFGQVNSVSMAFNMEDLSPLNSLQEMMKKRRNPGLALFVMLSTHDGRSVQGLGLQNTDGYSGIEQFYDYKKIIEQNGGKSKYRSVAKGKTDIELFRKVLKEAGLEKHESSLLQMFIKEGNSLVLKSKFSDPCLFIEMISSLSGKSADQLKAVPAIDYFINWIYKGKTEYELCSTSRSSFILNGQVNLSPRIEAERLVLAQLFVLTMGQVVPAVYFNDLLGLLNDREGFSTSGKPRDLNRKKSTWNECGLENMKDEFLKTYVPLLNRMIGIRVNDRAFFPGSPDFKYLALSDKVFVNCAYHANDLTIVIGNISGKTVSAIFDTSEIPVDYNNEIFLDQIKGTEIILQRQSRIELTLKPYNAYYLKQK